MRNQPSRLWNLANNTKATAMPGSGFSRFSRVWESSTTKVLGSLFLLLAAWLLCLVVVKEVGVDAGSLIALVGGLIGTVFTLGGLVVALVSVYTQMSLQDRATRFMEQKFSDLVPAFEQEVDRRVAARIAFRDALEAMRAKNWPLAEQLTEQTLEHYSAFPNARSTLALRLYRYLISEHHRNIVRLKKPDTDESVDTFDWLLKASEHGDNPDGQVTAALAVIYGSMGRGDKMLVALASLQPMDEATKAELRTPKRLIHLANGCGPDTQMLKTLGSQLGTMLPKSEDDVVASMKDAAIDAASTTGHAIITWFVLPRHRLVRGSTSDFPLAVNIHVRQDERGIIAHALSSIGVYPEDQTLALNGLPTEELVALLSKSFLFICSDPAEASL